MKTFRIKRTYLIKLNLYDWYNDLNYISSVIQLRKKMFINARNMQIIVLVEEDDVILVDSKSYQNKQQNLNP